MTKAQEDSTIRTIAEEAARRNAVAQTATTSNVDTGAALKLHAWVTDEQFRRALLMGQGTLTSGPFGQSEGASAAPEKELLPKDLVPDAESDPSGSRAEQFLKISENDNPMPPQTFQDALRQADVQNRFVQGLSGSSFAASAFFQNQQSRSSW